MKFKLLFENDKDRKKFEKLKQKLMSGKNLSYEDEDWYTEYQLKKIRNKNKEYYDYNNALSEYLSKNKEYQILSKKFHKIWEEMEKNRPGHSKDNRKWSKLKKEYDRLSNEMYKIKEKFYNEYWDSQ